MISPMLIWFSATIWFKIDDHAGKKIVVLQSLHVVCIPVLDGLDPVSVSNSL